MATKVNHKASIRHTFAARPDLKEVHILPSGDHYFDKRHAEEVLAEGEAFVTLTPESAELLPTGKDAPKAPTTPQA